MSKIKRIKGTQDILPDQVTHWQRVESSIRDCMSLFNYEELRTPVFESTELFSRGIGQATDIVSKEMYTFLDRGKKSLTLKPEMTAPIIRAYLENNMAALKPLTKIYYIAPLFRQENPQAGRLRQFNQFGAEAIGSSSPELDAEIIMLVMEIYKNLGISGLKVIINSVGDPESRDIYRKKLIEYYTPLLPKYCPDCQVRYKINPLRMLDCKVKSCQELNRNAPRFMDHFNSLSSDHFTAVQESLKNNRIEYSVDPYLVRGLDYYTHTVFEVTSGHLGSQDAVCGGGRYDLLAQQFGGPPTPAVGFASGLERLLMVMNAQNLLQNVTPGLDIFISPLGEKAKSVVLNWLIRFRRAGFKADTDYLNRSIKSQMREANRQLSKFVLILGDAELMANKFSVKDMTKSIQVEISFEQIETYLKANIKHNQQ